MQKSKYIDVAEADLRWGLAVSAVGYEEATPGAPVHVHGHVGGFSDKRNDGAPAEYRLLYVVEGAGTLTNARQEQTRVREGDMIMLLPQQWHSYGPLRETGWKCHWIVFCGPLMDARLEAGLLDADRPVRHIGFSGEAVELFNSAYDTAQKEPPLAQTLLAGIVSHIIGLARVLEHYVAANKTVSHASMVSKARLRMKEALESSLSIQQIAEELGVSYSSFRKLFKIHTGFSPATYQQELKLQRAKELLSTTDMSVKEIAYRLETEEHMVFENGADLGKGGAGFIRMNLATSDMNIERGMERLKAFSGRHLR